MSVNMDKAERKLKKVKINLMRNPKFALWSGVMMVGKTSVVDDVPTACTNGRDEMYGREFVTKLDEKALGFVVLHENMHKALRHLTIWEKLYRKNPELMNISHEPKAVAGEFVLPNNRPVTFRLDPINQQWTTSDVILPYTHRVNREKSNLVRKSYAKFKRYMSGIVKLRTEVREKTYWAGQTETEHVVVITKEELQQYTTATRTRNTVHPFIRLIPACDDMAQNLRGMMLSDDPQLNYSAFLQIARSAYGYGYVPNSGFAVYVDAIFDTYNKLLLFIHKHEVLERVQTSTDSAKRDAYGAWFE